MSRTCILPTRTYSTFFTLPVLQGDPKAALKEPFSVMLSEETAKKYFGRDNPMNKVLRANNQF